MNTENVKPSTRPLPYSKPEPSVHFFLTRAGGGHYAALAALRAVIMEQQRPWRINVTESMELFEPLDAYKKLFGISGGELYNRMLQKGWTWAYHMLLPLNRKAIQYRHDAGVGIATEHWRRTRPDVLVSLVPFFNRVLWDSLQQARPGTPVITVATDLADYPPHYWIEPKTQNYLVCGSERLVEQARAMGIAEDHIFRTSGMVIHPKFHEPVPGDRGAQRRELGLEPERPTGIVSFGGYGSKVMVDIVRNLARFGDELQLILIRGHNEKLADTLRNICPRLRKCVIGFTDRMPCYMRLADFFIGKPGSGSISEALAMRLPVIVERNISTMPQERYNTDWIRERQVGLVIDSFRNIAGAVETLLRSGELARYRANTMGFHNRAVFEVPDIIQAVLVGMVT
uniref:1,2-diacylglycerol 3-beta-galactosyltransferase n=1 Tax=Candidatus Kentrum sp. FW TaxID=2126338 RepID=A0A450SV46_9GAMM|nr:MAG: 1,2-diacylglycerol 3-beta-galactosyltransferase [Candidatus Kentron sp. FW]